VKHDLKGVLKCIGVEICTHCPPLPFPDRDIYLSNVSSHTMIHIATKSNSTIGILWKTIEFKLPVFGPLPRLPVNKDVMINISHYQCTWTVCRSSQTETYLLESSNPQYTQVHRVSYFNPTGIERHRFLILS
jgi:hypothetical protein